MESLPVENNGDLVETVNKLENEKKKMHDEFNIQRAKLKDLFLQKEAECLQLKRELDEMKTEFLVAECKKDNEIQLIDRKAQEEISSLQHLVQETIEESVICKNELEKILDENGRLKYENKELKEQLSERQESSSLVPVFSHVKKTLTKKLVGEAISGGGSKDDSLDDSMRKAQEDAEVLRSLVVPLEEEIKALKEKLRSTDEDLQSYRNVVQSSQIPLDSSSHANSQQTSTISTLPIQLAISDNLAVNKSTSMEFNCNMCKTLEEKNSHLQNIYGENKQKLERLQKSLNDSKDELVKEATLRKDLEKQWQEKREAHKEEVALLTEQVKKNEKELNNVKQQFFDVKEEINRHLSRLTENRENVNKHLETLQSDNDFLSGQFLATSEELESQNINLPNNVEELQELLLQLRSDLIQARVDCEYEKRKNVTFIDENNILRDQFRFTNQEKEAYEKKVQSKIKSLEDRLRDVLTKGENYEAMKEKSERKESDMNKQIAELRVQVIELQGSNEKLERGTADLKSKVMNLQEDLSTSEHVQKDFVKLSQSLQIALEDIRQADAQVRWQDDEDVEKCPNCNILFTVTCRKQHCRHCGKIFCEKCLTKTVPSGPRKKLARVCDICHTVLTPNTAPYFSKEPPQSPV